MIKWYWWSQCQQQGQLPVEVSEHWECRGRASVNFHAVEILCIFCLQNIPLICERIHHLLSFSIQLATLHCTKGWTVHCEELSLAPCEVEPWTSQTTALWRSQWYGGTSCECNPSLHAMYTHLSCPSHGRWKKVRIRGMRREEQRKTFNIPSIDSPYARMFWNITSSCSHPVTQSHSFLEEDHLAQLTSQTQRADDKSWKSLDRGWPFEAFSHDIQTQQIWTNPNPHKFLEKNTQWHASPCRVLQSLCSACFWYIALYIFIFLYINIYKISWSLI